jgi:hypothetical protein
MSRLGTVYVTQAHFDVELGILRQIWRRLQKVRAAMADLRSKEGYRQAAGTAEKISAPFLQENLARSVNHRRVQKEAATYWRTYALKTAPNWLKGFVPEFNESYSR